MRHPCASLGALVMLGAMLMPGAPALAAEPVVLTLDRPETAGVCGFRALWDAPIVLAEDGPLQFTDAVVKDKWGTASWSAALKNGRPAAIALDALHRAVLVRFPDAAEKVAERINQGYAVEKVELVLPLRDVELWPWGSPDQPPADGGYSYRANWGVDKRYRANPPRWHAVAWALRRPWTADPKIGPTFNAAVAGAAYWTKFGGQDPRDDRVDRMLGPAEVSETSPTGRLDVTACLADAAFGDTLGRRLRRLADCGFLLKKWELYDHRYFEGVYEWATATGGRAIILKRPSLVVTLRPDPRAEKVAALPPAADAAKRAEELRAGGQGGRPTAVMPAAGDLQRLAERHRFARPAGMPDWQWQRVRDLAELGDQRARLTVDTPFWYQYVPNYIIGRMTRKDKATGQTPPPPPEQVYAAWIDGMLGKQPRGWYGFEGAEVLLPWFLYRDAMPAPVQDHWRLWWTCWLMPDRPTSDLVHPMEDQLKRGTNTSAVIAGDSYYAKTGDWRGNKSFFRAGFNYALSTMNFNHSAAMGALLGGSIIGSDAAMADGRHGVEKFPLRTWSWIDGSTQESIDHYYFAITLSAQKMIADFGPTEFDRMMGRAILTKSVDELAGAYHPGLRRFIAGSARTAVHHLLATQDGVYHIVHTLSKRGVLNDLDAAGLPGRMPALGHEVSPLRVALQTLSGPWAPEWVSATVDDKPLPFEMTAAFTQWGTQRENPMWRRTYLGRHYGLYSQDVEAQFVPLMAQWRRADKTVEHMQERGTMLLRYGINETQLVNMAGGWIKPWAAVAALQHRNKMIVAASPYPNAVKGDLAKNIKSLQTTVALYNYESPKPTWEVWAGGRRVDGLPVNMKASDRITIKDGVTYLAVVPLPATDLGRDAEVRLSAGGVQSFDKCDFQAALVIDNYNLRREKPLADGDDWDAIDRAYGGFILEFADATEFPDFAAFQKHVAEAKLDLTYDAEKAVAAVRYESGKDVLELGVVTTYKAAEPPAARFAHRRVNGQWPYLPPGVFRDTPYAVQAATGRLEKGGAVLTCEAGRMAYLQAEPRTGTFAGHNPFPDRTHWSLALPGGARIEADGRLAMARVTARPSQNRLWIDYAVHPAETPAADAARALAVLGWPGEPQVEFNGRPLAAAPAKTEIDGRPAWVVPLVEGAGPDAFKDLPSRLRAARAALAAQ